jgi:hypothetical protein
MNRTRDHDEVIRCKQTTNPSNPVPPLHLTPNPPIVCRESDSCMRPQAASPSPLPRDVGPPFSASWGLHTKGGPVK